MKRQPLASLLEMHKLACIDLQLAAREAADAFVELRIAIGAEDDASADEARTAVAIHGRQVGDAGANASQPEPNSRGTADA